MKIVNVHYHLVKYKHRQFRRWTDGAWQEYLFGYREWGNVESCDSRFLEREYQIVAQKRDVPDAPDRDSGGMI